MLNQPSSKQFPLFLEDYGSFYSHLQGQFEELTSSEKGQRFAEFVQGLICHTQIGIRFDTPQLRQPTHDGGIDFECESLDHSELLFGQSKYTIRSADDIDHIFSKFKTFEEEILEKEKETESQPHQLDFLEKDLEKDPLKLSEKKIHYMVFTASELLKTQKINTYAKSKRPSVPFYNRLKEEGRVHLFDGREILSIAKTVYRKRHFIPSDLTLTMESPLIQMGNVYIGVVGGVQLKSIYNEFGDALFLENIREWLGPYAGHAQKEGRETVNEAIAKTLKEEPEKFLAKNNGITFRASSVILQDKKTIKLNEASIVNGCQTTMSIVRNGNGHNNYFVLVKVVEASDAWDNAGAANFQTNIDRIDLDMARYIRSRAISDTAIKFGVHVKPAKNLPDSVFSIFKTISRAEIMEDEIRALFIGLFSRTPSNAIASNYSELRTDILQEYETDEKKDEILYILFTIHETTQKAAQKAQEKYQKIAENSKKRLGQKATVTVADLFQRFWNDNQKNAPNYRAFLTILASCRCIGENFYEREEELNYSLICEFLSSVKASIENGPNEFMNYYAEAFKALVANSLKKGDNLSEVQQTMYQIIRTTKFENLYLIMETFT